MFSLVKSRFVSLAFVLTTALVPGLAPSPALAQDANVHQIYEAVQAGRLKDAESMIERVVREHPNSAKAHYVAAEVYVREGRLGAARDELSKAEQIDPLLSFAKPESIRALRADLRAAGPSTGGGVAAPAAARVGTPPAAPARFPWLGLMALGALVVGGVFWFTSRRRPASVAPGAMSPAHGGFGPATATSNYPPAQYPAPQPGAASGIGHALATAAAVGAGVVAGEAIAHHLMRDQHGQPDVASPDPIGSAPLYDGSTRPPTEHETDFGVRDDGGWNDTGLSGDADFGAGAGGSDDWT